MKISISQIVLVLVLVCSVTAFAGTSNVVNADNGSAQTSANSFDATPSLQQINELDESTVLLVRDVVGWFTANEDILLGMPDVILDIIPSASLATTDLSQYDFIVIAGGQTADFNTNVNASMTEIGAYVNSGGWLQMHMGTNAHTPALTLWDGTTYGDGTYFEPENFLGPDGAGHPILDGMTEPFVGNYASHGYMTTYPGESLIITMTSTQQPTFIEYDYGQGKVVCSTSPLEFNYGNDYSFGQALPNMMDWMVNSTMVPEPVEFDLIPQVTTVPQAGGDVVYDVSIVSNIPLSYPGLRFQTFVTIPNGNVVGPIDNLPWNLTPFMDVYVPNRTLAVPGFAPMGAYMFEAIAGVMANPNLQVTDGFPFVKQGNGWVEDFEDGQAQMMDFFVGNVGSYSIDAGFAKINVFAETDEWGSGVYTGESFSNFSFSQTHQFVQTIGNSVGSVFCTDGTNDGTMSGYAVYLSNGSYSAWRYDGGVPTNLILWTANANINQGAGAVNVLQIDGSGGTYDITCNGAYITSFADATYASGFVGFTCAYQNETWYDVASCFPAAQPRVAIDPPAQGEVETVLRDDRGVVITDPADYYVSENAGFDRSAEFTAEPIDFGVNDLVGGGPQFIAGGEATVVELPNEYVMTAAYPNPFNPTTTVQVALPAAADLNLAVYNITGQLVATLNTGVVEAGTHSFVFDAANLSSGIYFVKANVSGELNQVQKVTLMK